MKILVNEGITQGGVDILESKGFEVIITKVAQEQLENYINDNAIDAILVKNNTQIQQEIIDGCPSLKLIASGGSMDNIDVQYAIDQGLQVVDSKEGSANATAELIFAHLSGLARNLHQANREMPLEGDMNFKGLHKLYQGVELNGKTLGLIGINNSSLATAKIALGYGMKVVFSDPEIVETSLELEFFDGQTINFEFNSIPFDELIEESDFITVHLNSDNFKLGEAEFKKVKEGAIIINCVKGGLVDEIALIESIDKGPVRYAALDVFENQPNPEIQLLMNPNLSLSPNIAKATNEAQEKISIELANQIANLLS
ncbi:NAD(P)-dependent oxidoreductase [uncultured Tenacibaculum sp.]|uniref:NAD(P)-dependent oxidoreductase n=1 Tax=uncultured Tenacibaculum sp. TaxID=174713 RepID=UPI00261E635E|nr:NAD(P)-dependent oxidoreductase [uncultured Tenacibaculum sp.]